MDFHMNMLVKCANKYQKRALLEVEVKILKIRKRVGKTLQQVSLCRHTDPNNKLRVSAYYSSDRLNIYDVNSDISTHVRWTVSFQFLHILDEYTLQSFHVSSPLS